MLMCSILVLTSVNLCQSANILAIIPTPSYSHQVVHQPLWKELSTRGHKVTVATTNPIKDSTLTNLTEIDLSFIYEKAEKKFDRVELVRILKNDPLLLFRLMMEIQSYVLEEELNHPLIQKLIRNEHKQKYDVILVEFLYPVMYAFAEVYKCPLISVSSMDATTGVYSGMGNPVHPIAHPDMIVLQMVPPLSFKERLMSVLYRAFYSFYINYVLIPREDLSIKKFFGNNMPSSNELRRNISLLFLNIDPIFYPVKPLVPAIIPVGGGSHIKSTQPLPKDLEEFIGNTTDAVIYFSLGTNVRSDTISPNTLTDILEAFAELPYKIVWKFDTNFKGIPPENVYLSEWLPQQAILQHPKVKLFITQGGCQSIDESIYNNVPILGLPFAGDQYSNVKRMVLKGVGLYLDYGSMTKLSFKEAILELINNPKYRNKLKELVELSHDQPMSGLERAVWWTEYVIRNKGAQHLRSPFLDLPEYQYYYLDVMTFCLIVLSVIVIIFVTIVRSLYSFKKCNSKRKQKVQ